MAQNPNNVAATISKASGPVTVERFGETVTLNVGDAVYASDVISTGSQSIVLSFVDGASASLGPQSVMTVQEFSFGDDKADASFVLNLAQGAMRSISGKVVEQNPDAFKVITPKATAGIRGTDFITKVNADGSEVHVVISLDQGHNLVVTTHSGGQVSLTGADQGALIGSGADSTVTPTTFTDAEIQEIVQVIMAALNAQDADNAEGEVSQTLLLNDAASEALGEENLLLLQDALKLEGVSLTDAEGESFFESIDVVDVLGSHNDDGDGGGVSVAPRIDVTIFEDKSYFADRESVASGDHHLGSHDITVNTNIMNATTVISGDLDIQDGGSVQAGSDAITGGLMANGRVVGDVEIMNGGTLVAGNDTISFDSKTGGNSIYGDLADFNAGTVTLGNDNITIKGDFKNSIISGDMREMKEGLVTVEKWGNDTIFVGGDMDATARIYGDCATSGNAATSNGNDVITVLGSLSGAIFGDSLGSSLGNVEDFYGYGYGDDTIFVGAMLNGSRVGASDGDNSITINSMVGNAMVTAGDDDDIFTIKDMASGEINSPLGEDTFNVTLGDTSANMPCKIIAGNAVTQLKAEDDIYNITVDTSVAGKEYHLELFTGVFEASNTNVFKVNNKVYDASSLQVDSASNDTYIALENGAKLFLYF